MTWQMSKSAAKKITRKKKLETGKTPYRARVLLNDWLKQQGQPSLAKQFSHIEFATQICRLIAPRHAWRHFEDRNEAEAYFVTVADQLGLLASRKAASKEPKGGCGRERHSPAHSDARRVIEILEEATSAQTKGHRHAWH
jgi:hypothetical protein